MATGKVKRWEPLRRYGFIVQDSGGPDVHFTERVLKGLDPSQLRRGLPVAYTAQQGRKGLTAVEVTPVSAGAAPQVRPAVEAAAPQVRPMVGSSGPSQPRPDIDLPLPVGARRRVETALRSPGLHPGLLLDKYGRWPGGAHDQTTQRQHVAAVAATVGFDHAFRNEWLARRRAWLRDTGALTFSLGTAWRLTLHLSRAAVTENAGLALHPIYGFAYLPGTGLKGLAHAFAETVWLPQQSNQRNAARVIEDVFGWAPNPERRAAIRRGSRQARRACSNHPASPNVPAAAGTVVFHDAWPTTWPTLEVDIVNNHHSAYYESTSIPGDWHSPIPVYFLAVAPGTQFEFALSRRGGAASGADPLVAQARDWLTAALVECGAGAKTAAGYGAFEAAGGHTPLIRFDGRPTAAQAPHGRGAVRAPSTPSGPTVGANVTVTLKEQSKKGTWKAALGERMGPIVIEPGRTAPADWSAGREVEVQVSAVCADGSFQFRWPVPRPIEAKKKDLG